MKKYILKIGKKVIIEGLQVVALVVVANVAKTYVLKGGKSAVKAMSLDDLIK